MIEKRILLKISGESLMGKSNNGIDVATINKISNEIKKVYKKKYQICLIIGGGNIFRGIKGASEGIDRSTSDYMGMLATVMNALSLQSSLEKIKVPTRVQSAISMSQIAEPYIRRRAMRHLEKGRVVVFGGGCGNPFFTTDTTAALRAAEINAEVVMKATKVDGVYDRDPNKFKEAKKYSSLTYQQVLSDEIAVMDSTAIALCKDNNIPIMVFDIFKKGNISRAVAGESIGSLIS